MPRWHQNKNLQQNNFPFPTLSLHKFPQRKNKNPKIQPRQPSQITKKHKIPSWNRDLNNISQFNYSISLYTYFFISSISSSYFFFKFSNKYSLLSIISFYTSVVSSFRSIFHFSTNELVSLGSQKKHSYSTTLDIFFTFSISRKNATSRIGLILSIKVSTLSGS